MTAIRKEAMQMLEKIPEEKLGFVIQIMQGVNGLLGVAETETKKVIDLDQFVMPATERGRDADNQIVTSAITVEEYLVFPYSSGKMEFDVKPYIKGAWYSQLADHVYFQSVKTDSYTIVWENEQDICPDELYELSKPLKKQKLS